MSSYFETPSDTGLTHTELLELIVGRAVSDTGVTSTDALVSKQGRAITDTGATVTESLVRNARRFRTLSDTGSTITSTLPKNVRHFLSDTGATVTGDSVGALVIPAPNATFTYLCSRNWNFIEGQQGWTADAYARFTYTTIPD